MAQDVVEPVNLAQSGPLPAPFRTPQKSEKKRLNWLSWMRKSLGGKKKLCACGFYHHHDKDQEWPVFTTQMSSQSGKHFGIKIQSLRKLSSWLEAKHLHHFGKEGIFFWFFWSLKVTWDLLGKKSFRKRMLPLSKPPWEVWPTTRGIFPKSK